MTTRVRPCTNWWTNYLSDLWMLSPDRWQPCVTTRLLFALLTAPEDDEPVTEEEACALDDALEAWRAGRVHSADEVSRLLRS
ncbi:MAG: hypothetical protein ACR2HN_06495 [Tepidiformaceae bacterium]